jgi:hypothetical protein
MDQDDKAKLGRQALNATELLDPGVAKHRAQSAIKRGTGKLALRGLAALGRDGKDQAVEYDAKGAAEVAAQFAAIEAADTAEFEKKLAQAQNKPEEPKGRASNQPPSMAALRASFPEESTQFARLIFQCMELLDDVAHTSETADVQNPETRRREDLLLRVASLLRQDAGGALERFVNHVVFLSRNRPGRK